MKAQLAIVLCLVGVNAWAGEAPVELAKIECNGGAEGISLRWSDAKRTFEGSLMDNYNGANLICERVGSREFIVGETLDCVGFWDIAFSEIGDRIVRPVKIEIRLATASTGTAAYSRDWEGRDDLGPHPVSLRCDLN